MSPAAFEAEVLKGLGAIPRGITLLAAVSGGADSSALLAALSRLQKAGGFVLRIVHVEHGIRPAGESRGDARAVEALSADLGLPCRVLSIAGGLVARYALRRGTGIEAAARRFRYRLLRREALRCGAGAIVTAHTGDDALELALMRILRGSGPAGLRRMPFRRNFTASLGGPVLLRPLLALRRADVEAYLGALGIVWRTDTTNMDEHYLRNRIRHSLVPLLDSRFPGWRAGLEALGETQALAADFIEAEARRRLAWAGERELRCPADLFWAESPILREEALFQGIGVFIDRHGGRNVVVKRRNLRRFASGELRTLDLGFCTIATGAAGEGASPGYIAIFRRKPETEAGFSLLIKGPGLYKLGYGFGYKSDIGGVLQVSGRGESRSACGDGAERRGFFAALPFVLRPARSGDSIARAGKRFSLKDLLPGESGAPELRGRSEAGSGDRVVYAVQDAAGVAAFIGPYPGPAVILERREFPAAGEWFFCDIGGTDA
ncbi:MAG: tRNA lysidine(34) synthetase TilS [Treponema sp.]|nr:tRNA lysidine(34) synthetase TilS [Treponema sp.]